MPFVKVDPYKWPQDVLNVPDGFGGMPSVEFGNENVVASEFFMISTDFIYAPGTAAFTTKFAILATPQDGDFWCDSIGVIPWTADTVTMGVTEDQQHFLPSVITIQDARTFRNLIYNPSFTPINHAAGPLFPPNAVPINLFRKSPQSTEESTGVYLGNLPTPSGFRATQTFMQPFCFTRQGAINISVTSLAAAPAGMTFTLSVGFSGWKEYANASH